MISNLRKRLFPSPSSVHTQNLVMYFLAVGINRGMPFLLIPLLTNYLNTEEYGIVSLAAVMVGLLKNIIGFNPSIFFITKFFTINEDELSGYFFNSIWLTIISSVFFLGLFFFFAIEGNYFPGQHNFFIFLIFITALLAVIETVVLSIIQMQKKGRVFLTFNLVSALLQISFIVIFVVIFRKNWQGKLLADFLAGLIICITLIIYFSREFHRNRIFSLNKIQTLLTFSLPFLPHSISLWAMNFIDRFFLERIVGIQSVGLYSAAYNLGLGLMLIYDSLQRTWQPYFFESLSNNKDDEKRVIVKWTWLYYFFALLLFAIATCSVNLLVPYLFGKEFRNAIEFIPLIFLGYTFQGMYRAVAGYLYHLNKNGLLALITTSSAVLNVILNYWLISRNGPIGAAQSTAITFFYMFLFVKIVVLKTSSMPWFTFHKPNKCDLKNG